MPLSRRSVLQTLGVLPAAWYLSGLSAAGQPLPPCSTATPPPTKSIFVLLEGPWLIFPNPPNTPDAKTMTALTVGYSLDKPGSGAFHHECVAQYWNGGQAHGGDVSVVPDQPWSITSSATPGMFGEVIARAWDSGVDFVWADQEDSLQTRPGDRSLSLQVPTRIHIAGIQKDGSVSGQELVDPPVTPHIVTILQYDPPASGNLNLTVNGAVRQTFYPGDHLIFRMRHLPMDANLNDELQHIHDSFDFIRTRLSSGNTVSLQITSPEYYCGDSFGFSDQEMGLKHPSSYAAHAETHNAGADLRRHYLLAEYSNCCGGSIIGGGAGGRLAPKRRKTSKP